jgi:uncharacterized protein (TIGR02391 family)
MSISSLIPDADVLLGMAPEELAGPLLQALIDLEDSGTKLDRYNFSLHAADGYSPEKRRAIGYALMEAWTVLEREGLIAPEPGKRAEWVFVTRRGSQLRSAEAFSAYRAATQLPKSLLHPRLVPKVWGAFARGEYDTAVFEAFKEVEIAVRSAAGMTDADYGTDLMRRAFHPETGILSDSAKPAAERQALSDLFAGAIGSYKNPHSHRRVAIQALDAVEMIMLASHLLSIVDARSSANNPQ